MKYQFIKTHRSDHRVEKMCQVFGISRSGYYSWLHRSESKTACENRGLIAKIRAVHADAKKANYGSPRMTEELRAAGLSCSIARVARLMRAEGIRAKRHRPCKVTTDSAHTKALSPDLVNQCFQTDAPNQIWVSDITYVKTREGWLYLTAIIDLYARNVVGWSMSDRLLTSHTTAAALQHAYTRCTAPKGLIFHSDRGKQYAADEFRTLLTQYECCQSMSGQGNCYDNAVAERFFKTLKTELIYQSTFQTRRQASTAIFDYIETFYNKQRRHSSLGNIAPEQYLNNYYRKEMKALGNMAYASQRIPQKRDQNTNYTVRLNYMSIFL